MYMTHGAFASSLLFLRSWSVAQVVTHAKLTHFLHPLVAHFCTRMFTKVDNFINHIRRIWHQCPGFDLIISLMCRVNRTMTKNSTPFQLHFQITSCKIISLSSLGCLCFKSWCSKWAVAANGRHAQQRERVARVRGRETWRNVAYRGFLWFDE